MESTGLPRATQPADGLLRKEMPFGVFLESSVTWKAQALQEQLSLNMLVMVGWANIIALSRNTPRDASFLRTLPTIFCTVCLPETA
eukprot:1158702-Pelagomonas_calceolata.AAC.19